MGLAHHLVSAPPSPPECHCSNNTSGKKEEDKNYTFWRLHVSRWTEIYSRSFSYMDDKFSQLPKHVVPVIPNSKEPQHLPIHFQELTKLVKI